QKTRAVWHFDLDPQTWRVGAAGRRERDHQWIRQYVVTTAAHSANHKQPSFPAVAIGLQDSSGNCHAPLAKVVLRPRHRNPCDPDQPVSFLGLENPSDHNVVVGVIELESTHHFEGWCRKLLRRARVEVFSSTS